VPERAGAVVLCLLRQRETGSEFLMRSSMRDAIPSMFHRRLLLLATAALVVAGVLGVAAARLTTGQSFLDARQAAESKLQSTRLVSTIRGTITDRNGQVLAVDETGWQVTVSYAVINTSWAQIQAKAEAPMRDPMAWEEMSDAQRMEAIDELRLKYELQIEEMFQILAEMTQQDGADLRQTRDEIVEGVHDLQAYLWDRWQEEAEEERGEPVPRSEVAKPIAEQDRYFHHVVVKDVSEQQRRLIEGFVAEGRQAAAGDDRLQSQIVWSEVELRRTTVRRYPMDTVSITLDRSTLPGDLASSEPIELEVSGVGTHIVGWMHGVQYEDVFNHPFRREDGSYDLSGYDSGDRLGRAGVELAYEDVLRGTIGQRTINLDTRELENEVAPVAGQDVTLAMDIMLQARVQAIMSPEFGLMQRHAWHGSDIPEHQLGAPLNGAAVVIEVATGDVLAAVSMPALPRAELDEDPDRFWGDTINQPRINRCVAMNYRPGSIMKPFVLVAAVNEGLYHPNQTIACNGHYYDHIPDQLRCWIFKTHLGTHGPLHGWEAIMNSCNIFFYTLGDKMQTAVMAQWYRDFGFGSPTRCGLPDEVGGNAPDPARAGDSTAPGFDDRNDPLFLAIGQGDIDITPMQVASAYATLARGGYHVPPRVIASPRRNNLPEARDLHLDPRGVDDAMEGLRNVINNPRSQTGHHISSLPGRPTIFNVPGVTVYGKSGTADASAQRIDSNGDGQRDMIVQDGDHSWFVAMVQPEGEPRPTHVVAVVVEYGGSGGRVAGPVVNQIIHALQHDGYFE